MSSTNRGKDRHVADYYLTPQWASRSFLDSLAADIDANVDWVAKHCRTHAALTGDALLKSLTARVLDPCAGGDATNEMAYPLAISNHPRFAHAQLTTLDWRMDSRAQYRGVDFLAWVPLSLDIESSSGYHTTYDCVITNPPFIIAQEIITKALTVVRPGGLVVMLVRLNYFGSEKRFAWWQDNMPAATYIHSKRIGFTPDGKTDSIEYQHLVFVVGEKPTHTALRVI